MHPTGMHSYLIRIFTVRNEVAKVMFLQVSVYPRGCGIPACLAGGIPVCLAVGGVCYPSMHCRWYPSMPCDRSPRGCLVLGGCLVPGGSAPGGVCSRGVPALGGWRTPPKADGYWCGRYASYWNAFLLQYIFVLALTLGAKPFDKESTSGLLLLRSY